MYFAISFTITVSTVYLLTEVSSVQINFLFPKTNCSLQDWNDELIFKIRKILSVLDKEYDLILMNESVEFDFSGGIKNLNILNNCIIQMMMNTSGTIVCLAVKDIFLLEHITKQTQTLFLTDPLVNLHFGISIINSSDFSDFNYLFKVFHSSVWSILLLICLCIGITIFLLEILGNIENEVKYNGITIRDSFLISFTALFTPFVYNQLRTTSARIIFHIWQVFILIIVMLYSAGLVSLLLGTSNKETTSTGSKFHNVMKTRKVYCTQLTKTICNILKPDYPNVFITEKCVYTLKNFDGETCFVNFHIKQPYHSKMMSQSVNSFNNRFLVFVSNNISVVQEINLKILLNTESILEKRKKGAISSDFENLPIKLKHIYGPILLLTIGSGVVILFTLAAITNRIISSKIKKFCKSYGRKSKNSVRKYVTGIDETAVNLVVDRNHKETEV